MCIFCFLGSKNPLLEVFPRMGDDLPPFEMTFFLPDFQNRNNTKQNLVGLLIDEEAYGHIPLKVKEIKKDQNTTVFPLRTEGDGNCLLRAISRAMWGTEDWHEMLRKRMVEEIEKNDTFYKKYFSYTGFENDEKLEESEIEEEWKIVLKQEKG